MGFTGQCFLFFCLCIINTLPSTSPADPVQYYEDGNCQLQNCAVGSTFTRTGNCKKLYLESVNITAPSKEVFENLTYGLDTFSLIKGVVELVYLAANLVVFCVTGSLGCKTQIIIDGNSTYKLEEITLDTLPMLPVNIDKLVALKDVSCKNIYGGSINLTKFSKMTQLDKMIILDTAAGVTIPGSLELPSLRMLTIRNSSITFFNDTSFYCPNLEILYLENNNLVEIPDHFSTFQKMKHFSIRGNKLRHVTLDVFTDMNQLEHLDLNDNRIQSMQTHSTLHLPHLRNLFLAENNVSTLNVTLWNLPALEYLSLDGNKLQQVPNLLQLITSNVQTLLMRGNPWDCKWLSGTVGRIAGMQIFGSRNGSCFAFGRVESEVERSTWTKDLVL